MGINITSGRVWVLGAADPEMAAIAAILAASSEKFVHAACDGVSVTPPQAYACDSINGTHWVECAPKGGRPAGAVVVDHHRPGDPGFGVGPEGFLQASSLGQVLGLLGREATEEDLLVAAGDHCPGAAYRGLCPGVEPVRLMAHRAAVRAAFQKRTVEAVLADVEKATAAIQAAPRVVLGGGGVADLRPGTVPELPEACLRLGVPVVYQTTERDGRHKVGILGAGEGTPAGAAPVTAFIAVWAPAQGLTGVYGDPVRGYAGGYLA